MPEQDLQDAVERPSETEELIAELEVNWTYDVWFTGWHRRPAHAGMALVMADAH